MHPYVMCVGVVTTPAPHPVFGQVTHVIQERDQVTAKLAFANESHEQHVRHICSLHQQHLEEASRAHSTNTAADSAEVKQLREKLSESEMRAMALQYKLQDAEHALASSAKELESSQASFTTAENEASALRAEQDRLHASKTQLTATVADRDAEIARLTTELSAVLVDHKAATAQATHAAAVESGSLRSELKSLQANAKRTAAELKAHEKQSLLNDSATHQLKATMSSMEIAITNEKATVERLSSEMKVQISSLESQLQSVTITNQQTLFGLKAGHEKQVQTITEETAQLRSRVKQTQSDLANR